MKIRLLTAILLICSIYTNAQTGSYITLPIVLGTSLNQDVIIETQNLERMRFKNTGLIGIGTKTPTEALDIFGNLKVSGNGLFGGSISTSGSIKTDTLQTKTAGVNLIHKSPSLFQQNVYITGNTSLTGSLSIIGLSTLNSLQVNQNANFASNLNVAQNTTLNTLTASGLTNFSDNVNIQKNLAVTGNTQLTGTLNTTGLTTLNGLQVNQNANFVNNLNVGQNTTLNTLTTNGIASFINNANFQQNVSVAGNTNLTGTLNATGLTTLNGLQVNQNANFASNLNVAQNATLNALTTNGVATFANTANFQNNVAIAGNASVNGQIQTNTIQTDSIYSANIINSGNISTNSINATQGFQSKNITTNTILTDSIHATNRMEIGHSMVLLGGSTQAGTSDQIYTDDTNPLLIQSNALYNYPTIINANNTANVGIGTTTPSNKLEVNGSVYASGSATNSWTNSNWHIPYIIPNGSAIRTNNVGSYIGKYLGFGMSDDEASAGWFWIASCTTDNSTNPIYPMSLLLTPSGQASLTVSQFTWCDYVFTNDHKRMGFEEQLKYYATEKHLRGIASEKEIAKNGLNVNETLKGLTLNVEEAKLDMIDLYKLIEQQKKALEEQQKQIEKLKEEVSNSIKK